MSAVWKTLACAVGDLLAGWTLWLPRDAALVLLAMLTAGLALVLRRLSTNQRSLRLLREAMHVLMEGVPLGLDLNGVGHRLARVEQVVSVHDLHIWTLSSGTPALSAHVVLRDMAHWPEVLAAMQGLLRREYTIEHVTLQPELRAPAGDRIYPLTQGKSKP